MKSLSKFSFVKTSFIYMAINILVASIGFVRSFAFMNFFNFKELGIITLVSTSASLISFFQIGLINGGYRIIALENSELRSKTNNVVFSFFAILLIILFLFSILGYCFGLFSNGLIIIIINVLGISILLTNWLTNTLIGGSEFKRLNIANIISALASLLCLLLAYYWGLYAALISLIIQPLLFILIVLFTDKKKLPTKFDLDLNHIKYILNFGFIPFISGIFFLLYQQIERWSVNLFLGPEALGKMYLVFLTITVWLLIPSSINNLYFPRTIKLFADGERIKLNKVINQYFFILIFYCFVCVILILTLLPPLVKLIFPKHYDYVNLVFIILPGMVFRNMCDPISLLLNSMVKLKPILYSDLISTIFYIFMILFIIIMKVFSLENILYCYVLYSLIKFMYLLYSFALVKKKYQI